MLAYESSAGLEQGHRWHLELIVHLCAPEDARLLRRTERRYVDVDPPESEAAATAW